MTFATHERIGISKQRGFWLRYFLEKERCTSTVMQVSEALKGHDFSRAIRRAS